MSRPDYKLVKCSVNDCPRWVDRAVKSPRVAVGWYLHHDGSVLCPDHLPDELAMFMEALK